MKRAYTILTIFFVFSAFFFLTNDTNIILAQYKITSEDISIELSPEIPGPNQNVTIKLNSYVTDIDSALIIWKINGRQQKAGTGEKNFQVTSGALGEKTSVNISIRPTSGGLIEKNIVIRPIDLDILWEGVDGYTPPFYRGRTLPTSEGLIRVLAIPQVKQDGSSSTPLGGFTYKWKKQDKVVQENTGFDKNTLTFRQSYLNEKESIEVTAKGVGTNFLTKKNIDVPFYKPKILFYEKDPLLGIKYNHALTDTFSIENQEKTFIAEPYFIGPFSPFSKELEYEWKINDQIVETPKVSNSMTIKKGGTPGIATITLSIKNSIRLFLDATANLKVNLK